MRYLVTNQSESFQSEDYKIITVEESLFVLRELGEEVGLDTETEGLDPHTKKLLSVQIGNFHTQIMIDCTTVDIQKYKLYLESKVLFVLWNVKFDYKFFLKQGIILRNVYDGYLAEQLLWLGYRAGVHSMSLASAANEYLGVHLDKSVRGKIISKGLSSGVVVYGCDDVKYLLPIKDLQMKKITENELTLALKVENAFAKVLAYIEFSGIKLNVERWKAKMAKDLAALNEARDSINKWVSDYFINHNGKNESIENYIIIDDIRLDQNKIDEKIPKEATDIYFDYIDGHDVVCYKVKFPFVSVNLQGDIFSGFDTEPKCNINWNSSKQLIPFFEYFGFNLNTKDKKTGRFKKSVEAKVLSPQTTIQPEMLELYLTYTSQAKLVSTYGQTFIDQINPVTGRIHTQFSQLMTTGRLSCGGKDKFNRIEYVNIQNLPADEETRACFIPEKGNLLIDCDYSAQEDFIFTELSQEPKLIDFYNDTKRKRDGHSFVAKICFPKELDGIEEEEVKHKRPDLRALAKKAKFSIHYGGNGSTIARNLSLPLKQGQEIEKAYLDGFQNINNYFKKVKYNMWEKGYILISNITGHKMFIPNWKELRATEGSFDGVFWDNYRRDKKLWYQSGGHLEDMPETVKTYSKLVKTKGAYERNSLNAPVQGTAAIVTKMAAIKYFNHLVKENLLFTVLIVNDIHDRH